MKKVLKGGTVVSGEGCKKADVLVEDGKIGAVAPEITDEEAEVVDVSGKLLFPGFIDAHTHFDLHVSGTVTADNFETGTKAALSGQVLKRLKEVGGIAGVHCENKGIIEALIEEEKAKGHLTTDAHPKTRPAVVEAEAISRLLKIADLVHTPVIIVHLSSGAGYQEVKYARERGQEVILETCPQYLVLNESVYSLPDFEGSKYVIAPTIKKETDSTRLWNAIRKDHIQTISTDHCSFTTGQKAAGKDDFTKIPCGMPGVESRPALIYSFGVLERDLKLEQMCRLLSENPAKLYGVYPQKGAIAPGSDADIVVWNPDTEWTMSVENQVANVDYCPFEGTKVKGKAEQVYLKGELAARDGNVVLEKKGSYVPRQRRMELD